MHALDGDSHASALSSYADLKSWFRDLQALVISFPLHAGGIYPNGKQKLLTWEMEACLNRREI
jgi:hypothetical protein